MKSYKPTPALLAAAILAATATVSCDNDFDYPPVIVPVATIQPNTTIAQVKAAYWSDERNYADTILFNDEGEHIIIAGRVISSDETGNIYKSLVIQDETAALAMSINNNSLSETYKVGQEVVIDLTEMYIGKYNGLQQLGFPTAVCHHHAVLVDFPHRAVAHQFNAVVLQQHPDIFQGLARLRLHITYSHQLLVPVISRIAGDENHVVYRHCGGIGPEHRRNPLRCHFLFHMHPLLSHAAPRQLVCQQGLYMASLPRNCTTKRSSPVRTA